jgi:hypothetical protein
MPLLSEFERLAWQMRGSSERQPPRRALLATADEIESGALKPKHVCVIIIEDDGEGGDIISLNQGGEMSVLAVEGAMHRAARIMGSE